VLNYRDLALVVALLNALLVTIVVAVWGLVYYLAYLYTGSSRSFWPITAFYAFLAVLFLYVVAWVQPNGFDADGGLTYARKQLTGAPAIAIGLLFSLPVVIAAVAYGSLYFRVKEAAARYRIGLVAGAFFLQFGWTAASSALQLNRKYPNSVAISLVGSTFAILSALAFRPPRKVRARLRIPDSGGA
jgi:hypothetical protein